MSPRSTDVLSASAVVVFLIAGFQCKIVEIEDGRIEGTTEVALTGQTIDAFMNIPYAKPPVKHLRFQPPQPINPWRDVLNATVLGNACPQQKRQGAEDCLQLNVYTKNLPESQNPPLVPVIVYFHGGRWEVGSAIDWKPNYLLIQNVVLVTVNYRLGALGFLAVGTTEAMGNMGLKDQTLALKWVQKNIEKFGGDPKLVTIFGSSAGAFSATAHMVSPMSRGLFHRVIAMSGAVTFQQRLQKDNLKTAKRVARGVDCPTENIASMMACLKLKPAYEVIKVKIDDYEDCERFRWLPVIEEDFGQQKFLIEQPVDTLLRGNFSAVPLIIGMTSDEWVFSSEKIVNNYELLWNLNHKFEEVAPTCFSYESETEQSRRMSRLFRKYYLPFDPIDIRSFDGLKMLLSDGFISYPTHRFAHLASAFSDTFYYLFSFIGNRSRFIFPRNFPYGVHHGDDRFYLFPNQDDNISRIEKTMVIRLTKIFKQFALTGNPNNATNPILRIMNWPKLTNETEFYMDINVNMVEKNGLFLERFAMWENATAYLCTNQDQDDSTMSLFFLVLLFAFYLLIFLKRFFKLKNLKSMRNLRLK